MTWAKSPGRRQLVTPLEVAGGRRVESWADLWTSYYANQEPESLHVATMDDAVVGCLAGCRNTAAMRPSPEELTKP